MLRKIRNYNDWLKNITLSDLYEFMAYINNEKSSNDNHPLVNPHDNISEISEPSLSEQQKIIVGIRLRRPELVFKLQEFLRKQQKESPSDLFPTLLLFFPETGHETLACKIPLLFQEKRRHLSPETGDF